MELGNLLQLFSIKISLALYVFILSLYIIFECMSAASDTVSGGKYCISARYLFSAIAGLYLAKISFTYLYYVTVCHFTNNYPSYCALIKSAIGIEALYVTAIFFGCWPRMVYRLFGHKLDSVMLADTKKGHY